MKLEANIGDSSFEVEIRRDGDILRATIDGRELELEVSSPEPNVYLFRQNGKIHEFYVSPRSGGDGPYMVTSRSADFEVSIKDTKSLRGRAGSSSSNDSQADIRSMMPGKIVKIVAPIGTPVEKGDPVIVVEAMKMQNDLKAPKSGVIKEIRVQEGSTVAAGDILAVIE